MELLLLYPNVIPQPQSCRAPDCSIGWILLTTFIGRIKEPYLSGVAGWDRMLLFIRQEKKQRVISDIYYCVRFMCCFVCHVSLYIRRWGLRWVMIIYSIERKNNELCQIYVARFLFGQRRANGQELARKKWKHFLCA